jgi:hypothetical protein
MLIKVEIIPLYVIQKLSIKGVVGTILEQKRPPDSGINMAESRALEAATKGPPVAGGGGRRKRTIC